MVPDSPDVEQVLTGEGGVFEHAEPGALIIDFSSIRPDVTASLAEQASSKGFRIIDAPVSGGEAGAKNAALSIMVGGAAADFAEARPVLDAVGKTVVHVGPNGAGQTVKAANQLIVARQHRGARRGAGVPGGLRRRHEAALEVLGGGLAGSKVLEQKKANMLGRSFDPGFRIDLHHKDMGIVTSAAREAGVVLPLGAVVGPADGLRPRQRRRRPGPLGAAARRRAAVRPHRLTRPDRHQSRSTDMARMTAAQAAVEILKKEGVTHVFGLPGAAINPFYKAMRTNGGLHHTLARHVEGASHMAEGYTRAAAGQHRRLRRHQRSRGDRHDHRAVLGQRRLDPDPVHHRPGAGGQAAQGGLPGRRHRVDRQAADQDGGHGARGGPGAGHLPAGVPPDALRADPGRC